MTSEAHSNYQSGSRYRAQLWRERRRRRKNFGQRNLDYFGNNANPDNFYDRSDRYNSVFSMYSGPNFDTRGKSNSNFIESSIDKKNENSGFDDDFDPLKPPPVFKSLKKNHKHKSAMFFCPAKYHVMSVKHQIEVERQRGYIPYIPEIVEGQFEDAEEEEDTIPEKKLEDQDES